jgi:hypothetical protein
MNYQTQYEVAPLATAPQVINPESKAAIVSKMLKRPKGATLGELGAATTWQAHSVRAFLSGLRKKGQVLVKEQRKSGEQTYRIAAPAKDV